MEEKLNIRDLADGFSVQAKSYNKYWTIACVLSVVSIVNTTAKDVQEDAVVELPFNLGEVGIANFNVIILVMLCACIIAFSSALLQSIRIRKLSQIWINGIEPKDRIINGVHIQDFYDSMVTPTFNRIGPIPQYLQGKNQFIGQGKPDNKYKNYTIIALYCILKLVVAFVTFFIPAVALYYNARFFYYNQLCSIPIPNWICWVMYSISTLLIILLFLSDICHSLRAIRRIRNNSGT